MAPSENRSAMSADGRVATEAAWLNGKMQEIVERTEKLLTGTGVLMEGVVEPERLPKLLTRQELFILQGLSRI
jgi:hypothetical protein